MTQLISGVSTEIQREVPELEITSLRGAALAKLRGTTDSSSVGALTAALDGLLAAGVSNVVVDLTDATLIDSTVLGAFVFTRKRLRAAGGDLVITGANSEIRRILEITGLDRSFKLVPRAEEALRVPDAG